MIEIMEISKSYNNKKIIDKLSLDLNDGRVVALVGENGAGKSTTLKMMAGLIKPDEGNILCDGKSIYKDISLYQKKIGYMPDYFGVYDNISVVEYLNFFCDIYKIQKKHKKRVIEDAIERLKLNNYLNDNVDTLSMGLKQRVGLARCLINDPDYLILDEPMSGMDVISRHEFKEFILDIQEEGKSIVVSSHILNELSEVCTDIAIIEDGTIKAFSDMEKVIADLNLKNPVYINVLSDIDKAVWILKKCPDVLSVSIDNSVLMVNIKGGKKKEAAILTLLVDNNVSISGYTRKKGNLDLLFMKYISEKEWDT